MPIWKQHILKKGFPYPILAWSLKRGDRSDILRRCFWLCKSLCVVLLKTGNRTSSEKTTQTLQSAQSNKADPCFECSKFDLNVFTKLQLQNQNFSKLVWISSCSIFFFSCNNAFWILLAFKISALSATFAVARQLSGNKLISIREDNVISYILQHILHIY